ncbi:hypothetical protein ACPFL9_20450 [Paenarthrobacter sp. NyZ202]|uniref:hypothetical protein n=1 Tax=Paenarthrobacter sp. NyZ202 TaxID=3402689 RepID=UPI003CEC7EAA
MAFCIEDDAPWDARKLSDEARNHPKDWLDKRRPTFRCPGCEKKARFVNATKRIPHFGIVNDDHDEDCDYLGNPAGRNNRPGAPLPDRAPAEGNKEVRYAKPGPLHPPVAGGNGGNNGGRGNGGGQGAAIGPLHETTKLGTLLKNLRNRPDYPPENLWLDVPVRGPAVRATDYFHKLSDVTRETTTDGVTRAFWGHISSAQENSGTKGKETLWINCDARGEIVTIRVPFDVKDELYKSMGITRPHELNNAHVIVEGILSQGARKHSVTLTEVEKIAFLPPRT